MTIDLGIFYDLKWQGNDDIGLDRCVYSENSRWNNKERRECALAIRSDHVICDAGFSILDQTMSRSSDTGGRRMGYISSGKLRAMNIYVRFTISRAHSRSPASRRRVEDIGFVRSSVSTYSNI